MTQKTKPNWVEIGTLIIAAVTLVISGIVASFAWRLDDAERRLLDFRAKSEILHRLIVVGADGSCALENRLRVQQNAVWQDFTSQYCDGSNGAPDDIRIAGLNIELVGSDNPVFVPSPTLTVQAVSAEIETPIDQLTFTKDSTKEDQSLGFITEDGEVDRLFIPLAIVRDDGTLASSKVIHPIRLSWRSPVTNTDVVQDLDWFVPRDQWQAYDGIYWAQ